MHWIPVLIISSLSTIIFFEDFKNRSVHAFLFPLLGIVGFLHQLLETNFSQAIIHSLVNIGLLTIQAGTLFIYFRYVRSNKTLINHVVGIGDLLFLFACCLFFSPIHFLLYYILSLLAALLLHLLFKEHKIYQSQGKTVALAGWQALMLMLSIGIASYYDYNMSSDDSLLFLLAI